MKRDVTSMISYIVYDAGFAALRICRDLPYTRRALRRRCAVSFTRRAADSQIVAEFVGFVGCLVKFRPPCLASPFAGAFMFIVKDAPSHHTSQGGSWVLAQGVSNTSRTFPDDNL